MYIRFQKNVGETSKPIEQLADHLFSSIIVDTIFEKIVFSQVLQNFKM